MRTGDSCCFHCWVDDGLGAATATVLPPPHILQPPQEGGRIQHSLWLRSWMWVFFICFIVIWILVILLWRQWLILLPVKLENELLTTGLEEEASHQSQYTVGAWLLVASIKCAATKLHLFHYLRTKIDAVTERLRTRSLVTVWLVDTLIVQII